MTPRTPASCGAVLWRHGNALWATVIVKASFRMAHEEVARLDEPIDLVRADHVRGGGIEAASEIAPHIPNAGVLLSGHARARGRRPVMTAAVRLGLAAGERRLVDKTLHVFGRAEPFLEMPLVYQRAHGGWGLSDNPAGTGAAPSSVAPSIVDPSDPRRPAGFGPIAAHLPSRRRLLGRLDPRVLGEPVPPLPADFDWRYFQAAPADQQFEALRGEHWIVLDGMHSVLPRVQTCLPSAIAGADWHVVGPTGAGPVHEIELRADTLVIDADRLLCSVIWRGRLPVENPSAVESLRVCAGVDLVGRTASAPLSSTTDVDLRRVIAAVIPFTSAPAAAALAAARKLAGSGDLAGTVDADLSEARPALPFAPVDPASQSQPAPTHAGPPPGPADTPRQSSKPPSEPRMPPEAPAQPPPTEADADRAGVRPLVEERLAAGQRLHGLDLVGANLRGLDLRGTLMSALDLRRANLRGCRLAGARITGASLDHADLTGADLTGADLSRASLSRANLASARFDGAVLEDANLTSARGADASFSGADMRRAKLRRAELPGARFEGADLRDADLSGAKLDDEATRNAKLGDNSAANDAVGDNGRRVTR